MRKVKFVKGEYYHIFNRGTDKRRIFMDRKDIQRFFRSMCEFNTLEPIGSLYEKNYIPKASFGGRASKRKKKTLCRLSSVTSRKYLDGRGFSAGCG